MTATQHAGITQRPATAKDRLAIGMMILGLVIFLVFIVIRLTTPDSKWAVFVAFGGWVVWFIGKTIRKLSSSRHEEEQYLRGAVDAKGDETPGA